MSRFGSTRCRRARKLVPSQLFHQYRDGPSWRRIFLRFLPSPIICMKHKSNCLLCCKKCIGFRRLAVRYPVCFFCLAGFRLSRNSNLPFWVLLGQSARQISWPSAKVQHPSADPSFRTFRRRRANGYHADPGSDREPVPGHAPLRDGHVHAQQHLPQRRGVQPRA